MVVVACTSFPGAVRHADVNGARLAYVEQGNGPTVVLVHGSIADHRTWDRQRALLAGQYHVVAYTQRYFGTEPWRPEWPKIGVPVQSDDLAGFIRSLRAGPVHLVGWSSGGVVALNVALQHPELVRSAFVYEPPVASVVTEEADRKAVAEDRDAAFTPAVKALRAGDNVAALRLVLDAVDNRSGALDGWPKAEQAVTIDNARTLPLEFFDSDPTPPIACAQLGQLKPVVVVARGELTRVSYRLMADATARCIGGSRHVVVPGARHLWPADQPQAFSEAVMLFLRQQR
ncbi:alpha/beta fold hydrolase [Ideonella sp. YS5]|uniref:alpha/beta fold hydrolase n=1 Tax=Ideonella sp. YS5 TaxID=3453714 RepID=UPI003F71AF1C